MIHIDSMPEPDNFDLKVRQPGLAFLSKTPRPSSKEWSKNNFWSRCSLQLYQAYGGICAYCGEWFSRTTSTVSVDHFWPKSICQEKAYEWDNYRLTTQVMNGYKKDHIIMDPFQINDGDFVIDFPSCLVKPRKDMTPAEKSKANFTIQVLHLNNEDSANRRCEIVLNYIRGRISREFLKEKYPFIAEELGRQGLYDRIKEIIIAPKVT